MEQPGPQGLQEQQILSQSSPMEMVLSWQWVIQEPSSLQPMEPHGLPRLLEQQTLSVELLTEMAPSWQWVREE